MEAESAMWHCTLEMDRLFTQVRLRLGSRFPTMIMRHLWELELILKRTASLVNKSEGAEHLINRRWNMVILF